MTFSFHEFENEERVIETSFEIIIVDCFKLFVQSIRYKNNVVIISNIAVTKNFTTSIFRFLLHFFYNVFSGSPKFPTWRKLSR